jgi:hypothetical protein
MGEEDVDLDNSNDDGSDGSDDGRNNPQFVLSSQLGTGDSFILCVYFVSSISTTAT